ncbi:MAG: TGS domain-containing protein [Ignisphaera sp.]
MAELREEIEEKRQKRSGGGLSFFVEKEGAAQLILLGFTKSGKSALLRFLTGAKAEVSDVPYTTKFPVVGMMQYEDVQFQIVEAPSIIPEGGGWNTKVAGLVKNSDGIIIVLDASKDYENDFKRIIEFLNDNGISIERPRGFVEIEKSHAGGIRIVNYGRFLGTEEDVVKLLNSYRIYNAIVKIYGEANLDDVEKAIFERVVYKPALVLLNKIDLVNDSSNLHDRFLKELKLPAISVSIVKGFNKDVIGDAIFRLVNIIRIYTKPPNGEPSSRPLVLKKGATVLDVAKAIHKDFVRKFAYARVWGTSVKYPGQRVGLDHILHDRDVVEIVLRK